MNFPILTTKRLLLRPFDLSDSKQVQELANDKKIYDTTLLIPYPYPDGLAEKWIADHKEEFEKNSHIIWAITLIEDNKLIGAIGLNLNPIFEKGEFGFWIGVDYWNNGYASEALSEIIRFGFEELRLNKIYAHHFANNPSSGKVMIKNGMKQEGYLREDIIKDYKYIDVVLYSILRNEYLEMKNIPQ